MFNNNFTFNRFNEFNIHTDDSHIIHQNPPENIPKTPQHNPNTQSFVLDTPQKSTHKNHQNSSNNNSKYFSVHHNTIHSHAIEIKIPIKNINDKVMSLAMYLNEYIIIFKKLYNNNPKIQPEYDIIFPMIDNLSLALINSENPEHVTNIILQFIKDTLMIIQRIKKIKFWTKKIYTKYFLSIAPQNNPDLIKTIENAYSEYLRQSSLKVYNKPSKQIKPYIERPAFTDITQPNEFRVYVPKEVIHKKNLFERYPELKGKVPISSANHIKQFLNMFQYSYKNKFYKNILFSKSQPPYLYQFIVVPKTYHQKTAFLFFHPNIIMDEIMTKHIYVIVRWMETFKYENPYFNDFFDKCKSIDSNIFLINSIVYTIWNSLNTYIKEMTKQQIVYIIEPIRHIHFHLYNDILYRHRDVLLKRIESRLLAYLQKHKYEIYKKVKNKTNNNTYKRLIYIVPQFSNIGTSIVTSLLNLIKDEYPDEYQKLINVYTNTYLTFDTE